MNRTWGFILGFVLIATLFVLVPAQAAGAAF